MSANIHDVARLAQVSISTVSAVTSGTKYVSPDLRKRVENAVRELDYIPSHIGRALSTKRTNTLAYLITTVASAFNPLIIEATEAMAIKYGYGLIICNYERDEQRAKRAQRFLLGAHVDGVLLTPSASIPFDSLLTPFLQRDIPVVLVSGPLSSPNADCYVTDDDRGMAQLTRYLLGMGHKHIAFLGRSNSSTSQVRLDSVKRTMQTVGLTMPAEYIKLVPSDTITQVAVYTQELLSLVTPPTAIVCQNDSVAASVLRACHDWGLRVPQDISITGFDDTLSEVCTPPITTMSIPAGNMGALATEALIRRISNKGNADPPHTYRFLPELVVRASSGPPKQAEPYKQA